LLPACYRNIIIKWFNEEIKESNKNCKVNEYAVCFLYNIFFLCYFYSQCLYCFNQSLYSFLPEKVGGFEKSRLLGGCEKNWLLLLTLTFITNTKQYKRDNKYKSYSFGCIVTAGISFIK